MSLSSTNPPWWRPDQFARRRPFLDIRQRVLRALRGYFDAVTEVILSTEVPNPPMPANDKDDQLGRKAGSLGRLLPGLKIESPPEGVCISGLLPKDDRSISIPGVKMDEQGFLTLP